MYDRSYQECNTRVAAVQEEYLRVDEFEWDEENEGHCAPHGVTPLLVDQVKDRAPKFFPNKEGKTGTHMMIGPDRTGRFWTIIVLPAGKAGMWRAITGWPSTNPEISHYRNA